MASEVFLGPGVPKLAEIGAHYEAQLRVLNQFVSALHNIKISGMSAIQVAADGPITFSYVGTRYRLHHTFETQTMGASRGYFTRLQILRDGESPPRESPFVTLGNVSAFVNDVGQVLDEKFNSTGLVLDADAEKAFSFLATGLWGKPAGG